MAEQLIESMGDDWNPADYRDEFRDRLRKVIEKRMKSKGLVTPPADEEEEMPENAATNVVDFMSLLQQSLATNKRTPAKKAAAKTPRKTAAKAAPRKKAPAKKTTRRATRKAG
jgi:DNA end-binding protein Ku